MKDMKNMNEKQTKSYNDLLQLLKDDDAARKDVYQNLMEKEERVLNALSSAKNNTNSKNTLTNLFLNMSLSDIVARFAYTWQNIFHELVIDRQMNALPMILFRQERKLYVGLMLIFISGFLFLASM